MEKRRLQRTGGASLTVTLPKQWILKEGIQPGQQVAMYAQSSGTLLIKPLPAAAHTDPARLTIQDLTPDMVTREAVALFIAGANEIEFYQPDLTHAQRSYIRAIAERLIGFEIIDESADKVVLRNILDMAKLPIPDIVDKMFLLSRSMLHDAINAALADNTDSAADIVDRDFEIDKLYLVINRQFQCVLNDRILEEDLGISRSRMSYYRTVARQLERIADHAVKIAKTLMPAQPLSPAAAKQIQPFIHQLFAVMQDAQHTVRGADQVRAHTILNQGKKLEQAHGRLLLSKVKDTPLLITLLDSLDRTGGYLMNIAEATIDHSIFIDSPR